MSDTTQIESLEKRIIGWLEKNGYPLEMQVANEISKRKFDFIQSGYFTDPETSTQREIDIVSRITDDWGLLQFELIIECKMSKHPWVMFSTEKMHYNRLHSFSLMSPNSLDSTSLRFEEFMPITWFEKPKRLAYGGAQAFCGTDQTYSAAQSVSKASISIFQDRMERQDPWVHLFIFPIIVVDAPLFECYLDEGNNLIINKIESTFLNFEVKYLDKSCPMIRVVTPEYFGKLCDECIRMWNDINKILAEDLKEVAKSQGINRYINGNIRAYARQ